MSHEAIAYVKTLHIPVSSQKLMLMAIAERISNDTFTCFPGQALLAKECSKSERQIRRNITQLIDAGVLLISKRRKHNGYQATDEYEIVGFKEWFAVVESLKVGDAELATRKLAELRDIDLKRKNPGGHGRPPGANLDENSNPGGHGRPVPGGHGRPVNPHLNPQSSSLRSEDEEGANSDKPNSARSSSSASPKGKKGRKSKQGEIPLSASQQADEVRNAQAQAEIDQQRADEESAFDAYVALADELGLTAASYLTVTRRAAFRKIFTLTGRWPVRGGGYRNGQLGLEGWLYALEKVRQSPFCQGKNDRGWKIGIDQLLTEKLIVQVVEGGFDPRQPVEETAAYPSAAELAKIKPAAWEDRLGLWEKHQRAVWPTSWGPRPGEPGCGVPGDLLEKYGVNATAA